MIGLRRRWAAEGRPIASYLRLSVYLTLALLLLVSVSAAGALYLQSAEVNRLTLAFGPAFNANSKVLQTMTEAQIALHNYRVSNDRAVVAVSLGAEKRTMAVLATLQESLAVAGGGRVETAQYANSVDRQRIAVEQWWVYALSAVQDLDRGEEVDVFEGRTLFDEFRWANTALNRNLETDRNQSRINARTTANAGMIAIIAISLMAIAIAIAMGKWSTRSMSQPVTNLLNTVNRQTEGESVARADEDQGPLELRSLAVDFNVLSEQNLGLRRTQEHALSMHEVTFEIERSLLAAQDVQQKLDVLCAALGEGLGVDRVMANTVDVDHKVLLGAQWHLPDLAPLGDMSVDRVPVVGGVAEELWLVERTATWDDFLAPGMQSRERARIFYRETGARAVIMTPIGIGARVIGMIYVLMASAPREWTAPEVNTVQQAAALAAQVVMEARYREEQNKYIEELEELDRQKTDFLSTVSHELRTPMTSISGYLELLQDGDAGALTGGQLKILAVMDRNTRRLRDLIEDLLVLNRIDTGGRKINTIRVPMRELITDTVQELITLADSVAIELDIDAGPKEAIVQGDRGDLHRAFVNIVSNAIKFSRPGGLVTIRCTVDQGARRVLVTCQDRGIGIPARDQAQLFTRFYRGSNATAQAIPGTGLGLTIIKQIVEDHGGELRLTSVEGEGTTLVMELPLSGADSGDS